MYYLHIPKLRIGALIGAHGQTKAFIENHAQVTLNIDSNDGTVLIDDSNADPILAIKSRNVVQAIARGFSPKHAFKLFKDDIYLEIIDMKTFYGKRENKIKNAKARIIGKQGKVRETLERLAGVYVSVYGNTVSIIGNYVEIEMAKKAIEMLLQGSKHSSVYGYLERKRRYEKYKVDYY